MATPTTFQKAEDEFFLLRGKLQAGRITREQFDLAVKSLTVQDDQGRYWTIGGNTGKWYVHDGQAWVEATPPGAAGAPESLPPPFQEKKPRGSAPLALLALGLIVVLALCGGSILLFASTQGLLRISLGSPTDTPAAALAPVTPVVMIVTFTPPATVAPTVAQPTAPPTTVSGPTPLPTATHTPPPTLAPTGTRTPPPPPPTATRTLTPTPPPTPNYALVFTDDFSNPGSGLPETGQFSRYYEQGEYVLRILREEYFAQSIRDQLSFSDFSLETDARVVDGPENSALGIIFRYKDRSNYYVLLINNRGEYLLRKLVNNAWQPLGNAGWLASPNIKPKSTNRVKIVARGPTLSLFANNQPLLAVSDTTFAAGYIGVAAQTPKGTTDLRAAFDNLVVTSASDAAPATLFKDDFSSRASGWGEWTAVGELNYENGEYTGQVNDDTHVVYGTYEGSMVADFALEVDGHVIQNPGAANLGILFRTKDAANWYNFLVDGQGRYQVVKQLNDDWLYLTGPDWVASPAIKSGSAVNRLKLIARGSELSFYVNGQYLTTIKDDAFGQGRFGFIAGSRKGGGVAKVAFDNLSLYTPADAAPQMAWTPVPPTATPTVTPQTTYPGLFVANVQVDPPQPRDKQTPTFKVTFLNTLGQTVQYRWFVKIFKPEQKQSFGETAKVNSDIPPGTTELLSIPNWKGVAGEPCIPYIARVFYEAPDKTILEFPKVGGDIFSLYFSVCQ